MANYVKSTNFAVKDSLTTGDPAKVVKGTEIDVEFNNIASAINSKSDAISPVFTGTLTADSILFGTQTNKATLTYSTNTARTLTVPAVSGNRTFAFIDEAQTFTTNQIINGSLTANSVVVGTQTNKATINYATNTARTLTVPAVSGNRTFAFIDEAQTFTANQTIDANLIFSGNARRIQGKFDNYTNDAVIFQDSVTNSTTTINIAPNGTGGAAALHCHSNSDITNSIVGALNVDSDEVSLFSLYNGSNSYQPLNLVNGGNIYLQVNSNGTVYMGGVFGTTVGGTNRDVYIDDTGKLGYLSSTRKSKTNIVPIEDTSWLMSLEPVSFNRRIQTSGGIYTDQAHKNTEFGLIADDVAEVRPEVCFTDDFGNLAGIHYEQLIAPMLKEIQKLRSEVEALKAKG